MLQEPDDPASSRLVPPSDSSSSESTSANSGVNPDDYENDFAESQADIASAQTASDEALFENLARLNSELLNTQRELTKKNKELERLNDVKNQFLGMASHDLRSPLTAILGYSEFLLEDAASNLSQEQIEYLDVIHASSEFMLELVNDLLDIATIESGQLQLERSPVDLAALVVNNLALNRRLAASKQIALEFSHDPTLPIISIDDNRIEQVLNNLIGNAIKYSHPNSKVWVRLACEVDTVLVSVSDQGQGIPADEIDQLFQAFGTTSVRPTSGEKSTGLGLLITRRVIEAHGGRIWVESVEGQGSTFTFTLPLPTLPTDESLPDDEPQEAWVLEADGESTPARPLRVLVVEDSIINQRIITRMLEQMGAQVATAPNGAAALQTLRQNRYDLVLMDIYMPEMDGIEATARIRAEIDPARQPYIAAMSASMAAEDRRRAMECGADVFMGKPTPSRRLELSSVMAAARPPK